MTTSIETYTGKFFDFAEPRAEDVDVLDIARALSMTVRFGGHVSRFYSVADHALRVAELVGDIAGPELEYAALHHDSHEAYLLDVPSPLKALLGLQYQALAIRVDAAIAEALDFSPSVLEHPFVKEADAMALRMEARSLKRSRGVGEHWGHDKALEGYVSSWPSASASEARFLCRHYRLRRELGL